MNDKIKGRGSLFNLPNRFEKISLADISDELDEYFDTDDFYGNVKNRIL